MYGFRPYVSVAKRRAKAEKEMKQLKKKGIDIRPIEIEKLKITQTFWGDSWCKHIELFSDYDNRLPRGRTYVRNGSVCHLAINKGYVEAIVSGSMLYNVRIDINPLAKNKWKDIKKSCAGKIVSLLDLLAGKLSDGVMQVVCDRNTGLFPLSNEIKLTCDCPDWATMCKHVAAVLYGVGARLDDSPEHLFLLRGVDQEELIDTSNLVIDTTQKPGSSRRRIDNSAIANVFDIDLSETTPALPTKKAKKKPAKTKATPQAKTLTGSSLRKKRIQLNLSQKALAKQLGVSATTISNWERKERKKLNLREEVKNTLHTL